MAAASRRSFLAAAAAARAGMAVARGRTRRRSPERSPEVSGTDALDGQAGRQRQRSSYSCGAKQLKSRRVRQGDRDDTFVHGSSVSATPVFDLQIPGKPEASTMDWFARRGYDTWCVDCEGYGRSDKSRPVNADVSCGADDLAAASEYILSQSADRKLLLYGASSGALRARLVCATACRARATPGARRAGLDRRGKPDARRAQEEARGISRQQPPADRSRVRAQHLHPRPSRHQRSDGGRGVCRRGAGAGPVGADRNLCRHVGESSRRSIRKRSPCRS